MKILVAMANYGTKNAAHARRLIAEYRAMPFDVDIVVLCESPKGFGADVTELVGLPAKDPWSLPFAHRKLFRDNLAQYDVFIYTEDDTLIRENNIRAFLRASESLPEAVVPGFVRYEVHADGQKHYLDIHGPFHWVPGSVRQWGEYVCADLSNDHSACYILTRQQLRRAIASGGFSLEPHSGRYDLLCAAATDPYTQCGLARVICISHLSEFELHHLPNVYLNRIGLSETDHRVQIGALFDVLGRTDLGRELFATEKSMATPDWDKSYYEPCRTELLNLVPPGAHRILSVGCGAGDTEACLAGQGKNVTALPLDSVIGRLAERRVARLLPPDFEEAFDAVADERFEAIILPDVLQHLENPVDILTRLARLLTPRGVLVGSVPNLGFMRRRLGRVLKGGGKWSSLDGGFEATALHLTDARLTRRWLVSGGLRLLLLGFGTGAQASWLGRLLGEVAASRIVFVAGGTGH